MKKSCNDSFFWGGGREILVEIILAVVNLSGHLVYKRDLRHGSVWPHLEFLDGGKPIFHPAPYGDEIEAVGVTGSL